MRFIDAALLPLNSVSGNKDAVYPPGPGRVPFTWKTYFLLSGDKGGLLAASEGTLIQVISMLKWHPLGWLILLLFGI